MTVTATIATRNSQRLRLHIDNSAPSQSITGVIRTDVNGTYAVRAESTKFPNSSVSFDVLDYEYAIVAHSGVPVTYAVYAGSTVVATATITPVQASRGYVFLTVPVHPSLGFELSGVGPSLHVVTRHGETRTSRSTEHPIVDRSEPVIVLHALASAAGSFDVACQTLDAAQDLVALLARPLVFMLRHSDQLNLDMYFVVRSTDMSHGDEITSQDPATGREERTWTVTVEFTRVARPSGDTSTTAGWAYEDLIPYGTYAGLQPPFPTYADLEAGPQ